MEAKSLWGLFLETGAPEYYLMYCEARKAEESHVSENPGPGASGGCIPGS